MKVGKADKSAFVYDPYTSPGGGGKGGQLPPPPTVLGLDPDIRANPLRSVKAVGWRVGAKTGYASTGTVKHRGCVCKLDNVFIGLFCIAYCLILPCRHCRNSACKKMPNNARFQR